MNIQIEESWENELQQEFEKEYYSKINEFLVSERAKGKEIYPPSPLIFKAFNTTSFDKVKVVIIGQDPYHNPEEAMGLSFSVPNGKRVPPSLKNIYKEIKADLDIGIPIHGDLSSWAKQGVFLLNAILTVEKKQPPSHRKIGWQYFTDAVIQKLSDNRENLVFLLWGNFAKSKKELIDINKHLVLESAHPSPLARNAFFGNHHFSKCNDYLADNGIKPIDWSIS